MSVILNATTSTGLTMTPDNSGAIQFQSNGTNTIAITTGGAINASTQSLQTGGTTALYIDGSQNVGIGTSSPGYKLDVSTASATNGLGINLTNSGSTGAGINFLQSGVDSFFMSMPAGSGGLRFVASGTNERMRIDSSGNLLVGTTNSNPIGGGVNGVSLSASVSRFNSNGSDTVDIGRYSTTGTLIGFWYASSSVGTISTNGTNTSYNTSSDYRLKTNVTPLTTAQSGPIIDALKPSQFTWKEDNSSDVGFIAHEMQAVIPRAVNGEKDAVDAEGKPIYQQVAVSSPEIIAYLVAELQSVRQRLAAAETEIAALKAKVGA